MGVGLIIFWALVGVDISYNVVNILKAANSNINMINIILIYFVIIIIIEFICLLAQIETYNRAIKILQKDKNIERFEKKCKYILAWSPDKSLKTKLAIKLCEVYIEQKKYNMAFETLKRINPKCSYSNFNKYYIISKKFKAEYYMKMIYLNLKFNNIVDAQIAFEYGEKYLKLFVDEKELSLNINYTLGLLEYRKGNYKEADKLINNAIQSIINSETYFVEEVKDLKDKINSKIDSSCDD